MARNYKRDRRGRFARTHSAGRQVRRGARRGAGVGTLAVTAIPMAKMISMGTPIGIRGAALLTGQGAVLGGPAGALAGVAVTGGVYAVRRYRRRR